MKLGSVEFSAPTWDGKLVLAAIFILGYYGLVYALVLGSTQLSDNKAQMVRDAMLALSPVVGLIFGSLFRTTAAEERQTALRSSEVKEALVTTALAAGAPGSPEAMGAEVRRGAEEGARDGVTDGLTGERPKSSSDEPEILT